MPSKPKMKQTSFDLPLAPKPKNRDVDLLKTMRDRVLSGKYDDVIDYLVQYAPCSVRNIDNWIKNPPHLTECLRDLRYLGMIRIVTDSKMEVRMVHIDKRALR